MRDDHAPERLAYTIPEAARLVGVHRRTIEKKIKSGVLAVSRKLGRPLIPAASLYALFEDEK
jgi:excisionase family DNA binding protein